MTTNTPVSLIPFEERKDFSECRHCWALTRDGHLVRIMNLASTSYWGSKKFEVRSAEGYRWDAWDEDLLPVDPNDPLLEQKAKMRPLDILAQKEKEDLDENLPETAQDLQLKIPKSTRL